jgi:hypothetical protein
MQVVLVAGTCNCENAIAKVPENGTTRLKDCSFLSNWCTSYWDSGALFIMNDQSFSIVVKTYIQIMQSTLKFSELEELARHDLIKENTAINKYSKLSSVLFAT